MGKKHNGSLIYQLNKRMNSMFTPGASRHADKQTGADKGRIYSYNTYNTYKKECSNFCKFLKKEPTYFLILSSISVGTYNTSSFLYFTFI